MDTKISQEQFNAIQLVTDCMSVSLICTHRMLPAWAAYLVSLTPSSTIHFPRSAASQNISAQLRMSGVFAVAHNVQ